jgi:hypothetical protein
VRRIGERIIGVSQCKAKYLRLSENLEQVSELLTLPMNDSCREDSLSERLYLSLGDEESKTETHYLNVTNLLMHESYKRSGVPNS